MHFALFGLVCCVHVVSLACGHQHAASLGLAMDEPTVTIPVAASQLLLGCRVTLQHSSPPARILLLLLLLLYRVMLFVAVSFSAPNSDMS